MCKHYISNIVDSPYKKETETWPEVEEIRNQTLLGIFRGNLLLEHPKRKRMSTWRSRNAITNFVDSGIMNQTCHWLLLHVNMVILKYYLLYKMIQNFAPLFKILISNYIAWSAPFVTSCEVVRKLGSFRLTAPAAMLGYLGVCLFVCWH